MKIVILTDCCLAEKRGGVAVYAEHLKWVFPDAVQVTSRKVKCRVRDGLERAILTGKEAERQGIIRRDDIVIADGYWGAGLMNQSRVICVVHGLYAGWYGPDHRYSKFQSEYLPGHHVVPVSSFAAEEIRVFSGAKIDRLICNAANLDIFVPPKERQRAFVVGTIFKGDKEKIFRLTLDSIAQRIKMRWVGGKWPDEIVSGLQRCSVFLHLSKHEGNSYAVLEALSCNLPVVGTATGLLWDSAGRFGAVVPDDIGPDDLIDVLHLVHEQRDTYNNRQWLEQNSSFELFAKSWKEYIKGFR
jgi:hypothetical protein